jgi:hypothetical protein
MQVSRQLKLRLQNARNQLAKAGLVNFVEAVSTT